VAFQSFASNLVDGDTNGVWDVFVRDTQTNTTMRVSVDSNGAQGNNDSWAQSISADGRYVAFQSSASNLVDGDTNGAPDIFLRDTQMNTTTRISLDSTGVQGNDLSEYTSISADGRYVAFESFASNLVSGDTNGGTDIFVRDTLTNTTRRVSVSSSGAEGSGAEYPSISADGRYVAFWSYASNLVSGDTNGTTDIFMRDTQTNTTTRVSVSSSGMEGNSYSDEFASISGDGRYVAFESYASNLVNGDTNGTWDIFVRDTQTSTTTRISVDSSGVEGNGLSMYPSISADGRYVAFSSEASNLASVDTNGWLDVFVRDTQTNTTTRVSLDSRCAQGNEKSGGRSFISADGRYVAFESSASNLVSDDTNGMIDIFVHEMGGTICKVFTISGNAGIANAILSYTDGSTKTVMAATDGSYSFIVASGWSGTVTPSRAGYTFTPTNRVYADVQSDQTNQNYNATQLIPLIIIPGIGGSKLSNKNSEQWPRVDYVTCNLNGDSELHSLSLDTTGTVDVNKPISVSGIIRKEYPYCGVVKLPDKYSIDAYDTTINTFVSAGYKFCDITNPAKTDPADITKCQPEHNLFVFPYDWRKDVEHNGNDLVTFIDDVLQKTGVSRVDIFAHSMGGMLTRVVLANPDSVGKIRKVLTLGTPVLGTPKTLGMLEYKSPCFADLEPVIGCPLDPTTLQEIATNFPGVYQILPSPLYDKTEELAPLNIKWDSNGDGKIDGPQYYSGWSAIVTAHRNSTLLAQSKTFHDTFDNLTIQYVAIVGDGVPTPDQISQSRDHLRGRLIYYVHWSSTHGDGTVPLFSANCTILQLDLIFAMVQQSKHILV